MEQIHCEFTHYKNVSDQVNIFQFFILLKTSKLTHFYSIITSLIDDIGSSASQSFLKILDIEEPIHFHSF